jgi:hypothetical protein
MRCLVEWREPDRRVRAGPGTLRRRGCVGGTPSRRADAEAAVRIGLRQGARA